MDGQQAVLLLGSREDLSLCRSLAALLNIPVALQVHVWVKMRTAFPSLRSGDCMSSHLDLFQEPNGDRNQTAAFVLHRPRRKVSPLAWPDGTPSVTSGFGQHSHHLHSHCRQEPAGSAACLFLHTILPSVPSPLLLKKNHADRQRFLRLLVMMVYKCLLLDKPLGSGSLWHNSDPPHHHLCQVLQDQ